MLRLVSLARRVPRAEASLPALQTRVPRANRLLTSQLGGCGPKRCTQHLDSRWPQWVKSRHRRWSEGSTASLGLQRTPPPSREPRPLARTPPPSAAKIPNKRPRPWPFQESLCPRAPTCSTPFPDRRIKLSFASEPS